jgi:hypothetical protein
MIMVVWLVMNFWIWESAFGTVGYCAGGARLDRIVLYLN